MNNKLPWYTSWIVILLANFLFPLSLVLLILRGVKDRELNYTSGRTIRGVGTLICLSGIFLGLVYYSEEPQIDVAIVVALFFLIPGLLIRSIGIKSMQKGIRFKQYHELIYVKGYRSIHQIAGIFHLTPPIALKEITQMKNRGFLQGARIDQYMIELPQDRMTPNMSVNMTAPIVQGVVPQVVVNAVPAEVVKVAKSIQCSGCGNHVVLHEGQVVECEYCGNKITYS